MRSLRHPLLVLAFVGTVVAVPALAQQPSSYPAPCDSSKVSKADVDRAHSVFLSGKQFLDESNYDKAISYFNDAYSIDCSVHAILPIIATAYERKGDRAEAVRALDEYLRRSPNAPDREHVERRIKNLNDQLARDQASAAAATPGPSAASAGSALPPASSGSAVAPASASPEPATAPAPTASNEASPGGASGTGSHTAAPWIVAGLGGAATIAGIVLFAVGASDISSAESTCGGRHGCSTSDASKGNSGIGLEEIGVTAGVVGIAAVAGGLIWHFAQKPGAATTTGAFVGPAVAPGYAGIEWRGVLPTSDGRSRGYGL